MSEFAQLVKADNPGIMTLDGTNTWILRAPVATTSVVVDPGPNDETHLTNIVAAAGEVELVLFTHHHFDHTECIDRLVELITQRVKERLGDNRNAPAKLNVLPRDRGECNDDTAPGEDCTECGSCVVRRPWSVRAMEGAGAMRVGAPAVGRRHRVEQRRRVDRRVQHRLEMAAGRLRRDVVAAQRSDQNEAHAALRPASRTRARGSGSGRTTCRPPRRWSAAA